MSSSAAVQAIELIINNLYVYDSEKEALQEISKVIDLYNHDKFIKDTERAAVATTIDQFNQLNEYDINDNIRHIIDTIYDVKIESTYQDLLKFMFVFIKRCNPEMGLLYFNWLLKLLSVRHHELTYTEKSNIQSIRERFHMSTLPV